MIRLIPRETKFFDLFAELSTSLNEGAKLLREILQDPRDLQNRVKQMQAIEHRGDKATHAIIMKLNQTFITPFDREDIYKFAKGIDDVLDLIDHVADLLLLYQIDKLESDVALLLSVVGRAIGEIHQSIHLLRQMNYDSVREHIVRVHEMENEGDRLYRLFMGKLFAEQKDAILLLKYNSLYNEMEHAIDKCEDLMNSIETIMLKNA